MSTHPTSSPATAAGEVLVASFSEGAVVQSVHGAPDVPGVEIGGTIARDQRSHLLHTRRFAQEEDKLDAAGGREDHACPQSAAGIQAGADLVGKRFGGDEGSRAFQRAIPADELAPVAGPVGLPPREIGEGHARSECRIPGIPGQQRASLRLDLGGDERDRRRARP